MAVLLVFVGGCLGDDRAIESSSTDGPDAEPGQTIEEENTFLVPANAGAGGYVVTISSWEAFGTAPENVTGTEVEASYDAPTPTGGASSLFVEVSARDEVNQTSLEPGEDRVLHIPPADWSWNHSAPLWVSVGADQGSVIVGGTVDVQVTVYQHVPPPWASDP